MKGWHILCSLAHWLGLADWKDVFLPSLQTHSNQAKDYKNNCKIDARMQVHQLTKLIVVDARVGLQDCNWCRVWDFRKSCNKE